MALEKSEAVILKSSNWSESSRIVELFSREFGKIALVDKGGRRFKSKRGRLMPFARLEITFYKSEKTPTGYVSEAQLVELYGFEKEGTIGRLAYASAACELLHHLLSNEQPQPSLYRLFITFLKLTETVEKECLPPLFLAFFLHLLSELGYRPSLANCAGCGKPLKTSGVEAEEVLFCPERGGVVCVTCKITGDYYIALSRESSVYLAALQDTPLGEAVGAPIAYGEVSRLLEALVQFVGYQTGVVSRLKSLEFLEKLKNGHLSNGKRNRLA